MHEWKERPLFGDLGNCSLGDTAVDSLEAISVLKKVGRVRAYTDFLQSQKNSFVGNFCWHSEQVLCGSVMWLIKNVCAE